MRYFSLFSGIGGFELGIAKAMPNAECVGFSEIDKDAVRIYKSHFPKHENFGDITKIKGKELPDFDLLCGGFPCQSFSIAGKRKGFDDTRGTLFFDICRILKAKQPRLVLLENVKGLLSHDQGRTFITIIAALDGLGYDCQWQVLNSKDFGVPQNRERILIVGHLRGSRRPKIFPFGESYGSNVPQDLRKSENILGTISTRNQGPQCNFDGGSTLVSIGTLRSHKNDKGFRSMKSGLSPAICARARQDGDGQPVVWIKEATKLGYAEASVGDSINLSVPNSKTRRGRVGKGVAQTLDTGMQQYTIVQKARGFNKGGVMNVAPTLGSSSWQHNNHLNNQLGGVRRLTPIECERLQGFPDDWTRYGVWHGFYQGPAKTINISDTQRYKCLGNAVTTNVIAAVVGRMI